MKISRQLPPTETCRNFSRCRYIKFRLSLFCGNAEMGILLFVSHLSVFKLRVIICIPPDKRYRDVTYG